MLAELLAEREPQPEVLLGKELGGSHWRPGFGRMDSCLLVWWEHRRHCLLLRLASGGKDWCLEWMEQVERVVRLGQLPEQEVRLELEELGVEEELLHYLLQAQGELVELPVLLAQMGHLVL